MAGTIHQLKLYQFQKDVLECTADKNKVAYYLDMGLGKTFVGAEKAISLGDDILVVCQLTKVEDWVNHFKDYYDVPVYNLTNRKVLEEFIASTERKVGVINYDLIYRRAELVTVNDNGYTLVLDESSLIQNEGTKRAKFVLNKLTPRNVVLLSGTPTGGKYERLWSQMKLLGWRISKELYWRQYVEFEYVDVQGFPIKTVTGYKNVDRLKSKMNEYGCVFLKTNSVYELPAQIFERVMIEPSKEYRTFCKRSLVAVGGKEFVGTNLLVKLLCQRMLCGAYCQHKLDKVKDLIESTGDRVVIFYNFNDELERLVKVCDECNRMVSIINGDIKDINNFNIYNDAVLLVQYQSGAMGLNLQKASRVIYFTPTLTSELYEQSKKRVHRIGQKNTCYYYNLICRNSIEEKIYNILNERKDYTEKLFEKDFSEICKFEIDN